MSHPVASASLKKSCISIFSKKHNVTFDFYTQIQAVNENDWLQVIDNDNYMMLPSYFQLVEQHTTGQLKPIYTIVYKDKAPVAVAYLQVATFRGEDIIAYAPKKELGDEVSKVQQLIQRVIDWGLKKIEFPMLLSGNLFASGEYGLYLKKGVDKAESFYWLRSLMEEAGARCYRKKITAILMTDIFEKNRKFVEDAICIQYNRFQTEDDMSLVFDENWTCFDDYKSAMSSKYRVRLKKAYKNSVRVPVKSLSVEEVQEAKQEIYGLYKNVANKAGFNMAGVSEEYFTKMKRLYPDQYLVYGYYHPENNEQLIAVSTMLVTPRKLAVQYIGLDYKYNQKYSLYLRMLYDNIATAFEQNRKKVHFGKTGPVIKSTVGAEPQPVYYFIKMIRWPILNFIGRPLAKLKKPPVWEQRRPFKSK